MWSFTCPICLTTLYKDDPMKPWVCIHCGWRSDEGNAPEPPARLTHLTDSYQIV